MRRVGPIFGWFDNFDLLVCTPNGRRETHAMAIEFQQHPSGVLKCGSAKAGLLNLTIPRICKREVASIQLGSNAALARVECSPKPPTTYIFGPLIDAPPSHPDTVLTTLSYLEKTLTELGMKISNLSADMQVYMVATLIKWASHGNRFRSAILRPGGMRTLMSFNGCIENLMKASGLEVLVGAAFGGLTSIMNGKAWVKSMPAFRMVTAALL